MTMIIAELIRLEENWKHGTFGILRINKRVFCVTLEPPDLENEKNKSSIPAQQYVCRRYSSENHPDTYEITNVPGRDKVLFHSGNIKEHTSGCILLGQHFGKLHEQRAVLNSGRTFHNFMGLMGAANVFHLTIYERY